MSSRQLRSKGASDGQSLPDRTRKGKKSSDQQTMDQQSSPQPEHHTRPGSAQQQAGDSAAPAISPAPRAESTLLQATASSTRRHSCTRAEQPATTSQNSGILGAILQLGNTSLQAQN